MDKTLLGVIKEERNKLNKKWGDYLSPLQYIYTDRSVVEQASSHLTALYAASLINKDDVLADLTGGLGVNTYFFSTKCKKVDCVEIDSSRSLALKKNLFQLHTDNVEIFNQDCVDWLKKNDKFYDVIFIDPARRDDKGKRFFRLEDCIPNVLSLMPLLQEKGRKVIIKASPLLDITSIFKKINKVNCVHIIEVRREVKEVLIEISFEQENAGIVRQINCVRLSEDREPAIITLQANESKPQISDKQVQLTEGYYIYEPSPSIMKSGLFGPFNDLYPALVKFSQNTHLFYSKTYFHDFPGRTFVFGRYLKKRDLKSIKGFNYNVISRNHPAKPSDIETQYKYKPSDTNFIIATTLENKKVIFTAEKIIT